MLCARSAQTSVGRRIRIIIMKRTNGVRAAYDAFLLRVLHVAFGYPAVFNTSKEAYPWPLIVLATTVWLVSSKCTNTLR